MDGVQLRCILLSKHVSADDNTHGNCLSEPRCRRFALRRQQQQRWQRRRQRDRCNTNAYFERNAQSNTYSCERYVQCCWLQLLVCFAHKISFVSRRRRILKKIKRQKKKKKKKEFLSIKNISSFFLILSHFEYPFIGLRLLVRRIRSFNYNVALSSKIAAAAVMCLATLISAITSLVSALTPF